MKTLILLILIDLESSNVVLSPTAVVAEGVEKSRDQKNSQTFGRGLYSGGQNCRNVCMFSV